MPDTLPAAATAERVLLAAINYLRRPAAGKPTRYVTDPAPGVPQSNIELDPRTVPVRDGRGHEAEYTLDRHGFALLQGVSKTWGKLLACPGLIGPAEA